jgi:hypothetical protein
MADPLTPPGPQEPDVLSRARTLYPFINKFKPSVVLNGTHRNPDGYFAETFKPGDSGYKDYPRPNGSPLDGTTIEVYRPDKFSENDVAAEFLHVDPVAHDARKALIGTFDKRQLEILKQQGDYTSGDGLSDSRRLENATDALMRGYTVGQWPKEAIDDFRLNEKQSGILESLRQYMTTDGAQ